MQQVKAEQRFWWRALDAHMPAEPHAATPSVAPARAAAPWPLRQKPERSAPAPLSLEIPKADRRPAGHARSKRRRGGGLTAGAIMTVVLAAGAAAAVFSGKVAPEKIRALAMSEAQGALLELGFGIDQVALTGHRFTSDRDIYDALDLNAARTFAAFDAAAALKRIENLPWVESAQITRLYPGGLKVDVRERRPAALWSLKGRLFLVDATGRVLGAVAEPHGWQLPRIAGEGANSEALLLFTALQRHPDISRRLARADRIGSRRWSLVLANGSRLELGADREVEGLEQIARNSELRQALDGVPFIVDVRTPGRLAMRPVGAAGSSPSVTERSP